MASLTRYAERRKHDFRKFIGFPCLIKKGRRTPYEREGVIISASYDSVVVESTGKDGVTKRQPHFDFSRIIPICYDIRSPDLRDFVDFDRYCGPFPGRYKFDVINSANGDRFDNWSTILYCEPEPGIVNTITIGEPLIGWWEERGYFTGQCCETSVKFRPVEMGMTEDLFEYFRRNGPNPFNWVRISGMSDNKSIHLARQWLDRLRAEGEPIPRYGLFPDGTNKRVD